MRATIECHIHGVQPAVDQRFHRKGWPVMVIPTCKACDDEMQHEVELAEQILRDNGLV